MLERLNSVLEPSRTLVVAERGGEITEDFHVIAQSGFKFFIATMNPGGDFGKKELSPALRNRFTEIWVPSLMNRDDLSEIVRQSWKSDQLVQFTEPLLDFVDWLSSVVKDSSLLSLRDILVSDYRQIVRFPSKLVSRAGYTFATHYQVQPLFHQASCL